MFLPLSVCLSVCLLDYSVSKSSQNLTDFDEIFLELWDVAQYFGGDPDLGIHI